MNEHTLCCGTVADKAKLCAEIEKRDSVIRAQQRRISELLQERDEALAYAERFRSGLEELAEQAAQVDGWESFPSAWLDSAYSVLSETKLSALEAMKAKLQAEAIESILDLDYGYIQFEDGSFAYTEEAISGYAESIHQHTQEPK